MATAASRQVHVRSRSQAGRGHCGTMPPLCPLESLFALKCQRQMPAVARREPRRKPGDVRDESKRAHNGRDRSCDLVQRLRPATAPTARPPSVPYPSELARGPPWSPAARNPSSSGVRPQKCKCSPSSSRVGNLLEAQAERSVDLRAPPAGTRWRSLDPARGGRPCTWPDVVDPHKSHRREQLVLQAQPPYGDPSAEEGLWWPPDTPTWRLEL
mmetsp:Transcript_72340/g.157078  ORF Transcript_72340/g.157078 Transcript_72340/m.157078 type:complete len:213 (-) Transcript_72340:316-954(-)